ncbi:MAG: serine/threonine-protein phosphatase [Armatimonadetes bacterium]|nr:serine/threonine-protein phosphatase [Armatimonadota bacterium]
MPATTRYIPRRAYRTEPSEDSDLVVALFRFALIIAFTLSASIGPRYTVGWPALIVGIVAAGYTLVLMLAYVYSRQWLTQRRRQELLLRPVWGLLLRRRVAIQRVSAIVVDLALISAIVADLSRLGLPGYSNLCFDFYFVVVGVAAIWFHREGGIITALAATVCVTALMVTAEGPDVDVDELKMQVLMRALMFLAAGVVTGYLARAWDAERRERERLDWEFNMARQVQAALLPDEPTVPEGYDLAVRFTPASVVGGDYYDALIGPDGRLFVAVADVAGKSVYGVMHLSLLRSALREAIIEGLRPGEVAARLNATLAKTLPPSGFVSLFCGAIELASGEVRYANCGHVPPVLLRREPEAAPEELFTGNIVLGVEEKAVYDEAEATLREGDVLICCTDGLTDALSGDWEAFGTEGVAAAARSAPGADAGTLAGTIVAAADRHRKTPASDDVTILVVRRLRAEGDAQA